MHSDTGRPTTIFYTTFTYLYTQACNSRHTLRQRQNSCGSWGGADALGVTLDYLVKDAEYQNIDQDALTRLKLIEKLPQEERSHLFATMDAFFAKNKLQALLK